MLSKSLRLMVHTLLSGLAWEKAAGYGPISGRHVQQLSVSCINLPDNIAVEGLVRQRLKEWLLTLALLLAWPWPQVKHSSSKVPRLAHDDNPHLCAACHLLQAVQELPVCQGGPAVHLRHK